MYKLYWGRGSANMAPHAVLEEIGALQFVGSTSTGTSTRC
jgi:hypothetical protein